MLGHRKQLHASVSLKLSWQQYDSEHHETKVPAEPLLMLPQGLATMLASSRAADLRAAAALVHMLTARLPKEYAARLQVMSAVLQLCMPMELCCPAPSAAGLAQGPR